MNASPITDVNEDRKTAKAIARNLRISPQKLNLVAMDIRGMDAGKATSHLKFSRRRIAADVLKCLESAIANAENNQNMNIDNLIVKEAYVGKALVMKRFRVRGRGRSTRILKPFANLTIILQEQDS